MKFYLTIIFFVTIISCNSVSPDPSGEVQQSSPEPASKKASRKFIELKDTIRIDFKTDKSKYSPVILESIIDKIVQKGIFKPGIDKKGRIDIQKDNIRNLTIAYDSADMHFFIIHEYLLYNMHIQSVGFSAPRTKKNPQYKRRFHLEEWTFNNNMDRDNAFNTIEYIHSHPKSIVMYEKMYTQLIKAPNRLIILQTGADIFKRYVVEYGELIKRFINSNYR